MSSKSKPKTILRQKSLIVPEVYNPFTFSLRLSLLDKIKVAICTITLFPIRLICAVLLLLIAGLFAAMATACMTKQDLEEPLSRFRRVLRAPVKWCARGILFCLGFQWVKIRGKLQPPEEAPVIAVAPHSTFVDALALSVLGSPAGVSRKENDKIPIVGTIIRCLQPIYVARSDSNSRQNTIAEIKRRANSAGKWPHLCIFPEGTCTNRHCLITFKPGAFYAGCPVQPIVLKYPNRLDTVTWTWSGPGAAKLLWLTMCQFHNFLEVEILPVYQPCTEEICDAKLFARNVRAQMASILHVPVTEHAYEDTRLMLEASQKNLPASAGLVEYQKISTKLSVRVDSMKELLHRFAEIDSNADGLVDLHEFAAFLNLPVTPHVEELFSLYDRDDSGYIDFREYLIGMLLVAKPANNEDAIRLAFEVFDVNKDGRVTELELKHILQSAFPSMRELDINCLFKRVDASNKGSVTFEEFRDFAEAHPEYAVIFTRYKKDGNADEEPGTSGEISDVVDDATLSTTA